MYPTWAIDIYGILAVTNSQEVRINLYIYLRDVIDWTTFIIRWNLSLKWDTSTQGTQNLVPEKYPHNLCTCYLFWTNTSIQGKGTLFLGPETWINLHSGDTLAIKTWLTTKRVDFLSVYLSQLWKLSQTELSHLNRCNAILWINHNIYVIEIS